MNVSALADIAIERVSKAVIPLDYAEDPMLLKNRPTATLKGFMRVLPYRQFVHSLGITINLGEHKSNPKTLGEYNHEEKNVINIYSLSTQVWLHEVVHAIDDRLFGIRRRIDEGGDNVLTAAHEYVADLGAVMLLLSLGRSADYIVAKNRVLFHLRKDINERGLEVSGVPFETDEEKVRWACRQSRRAAIVCVDYILAKGKP